MLKLTFQCCCHFLDSYQCLLVLSPQSKQNQSVFTADQKVPCYGAAGHSNGTLWQRDLNDLHLHSAPHRCPTQEVAQQTHPDTGLVLRLDRKTKNMAGIRLKEARLYCLLFSPSRSSLPFEQPACPLSLAQRTLEHWHNIISPVNH